MELTGEPINFLKDRHWSFAENRHRGAEYVTERFISEVTEAGMPANRSYSDLADQLLNTWRGNYVSQRLQTRSALEDNNLPGPNSEQEPLSLESFRVARFGLLEAPDGIPSTGHDDGSGPL